MSREIMQQALDALDMACAKYGDVGNIHTDWGKWDAAGTALRQALAQPEQEPVAQIRIKNGYWIDTPRSAKVKSLPDGLHDLYTAPPRKPDVPLIGEGNRQNIKLAQDEIDSIVEAHVVDAMKQGLNG